jgi:hypothetical protein
LPQVFEMILFYALLRTELGRHVYNDPNCFWTKVSMLKLHQLLKSKHIND